MNKKEAILEIVKNYDDGNTIFIATDGLISREMWGIKQKNVFPMVGSMGLAPAIGLGIALNSNKKVVVINGDGGFVMSAGTQFLISYCMDKYNKTNLYHIVLNNGTYETTGGQKCVCPQDLEHYGFGHLTNINIDQGGEKPPRILDLKKIASQFRKEVRK